MNCAEPVGTLLLKLPTLPDFPSTTATCMSPAVLLNNSSRTPPSAIRTLTGHGSNRLSLRATPPCATSFLAGHHPYQPTFCRISLRTSTPPSQRFRSLLAKVGYTPPTTAASCSSVNRLRKTPSDSQHPVGRAARLLNNEPIPHLRTAAHASLGHAGLPFDSFLPPRHHAHSANARTFLLVDWNEHPHPVASPLPEVLSTEDPRG